MNQEEFNKKYLVEGAKPDNGEYKKESVNVPIVMDSLAMMLDDPNTQMTFSFEESKSGRIDKFGTRFNTFIEHGVGVYSPNGLMAFASFRDKELYKFHELIFQSSGCRYRLYMTWDHWYRWESDGVLDTEDTHFEEVMARIQAMAVAAFKRED